VSIASTLETVDHWVWKNYPRGSQWAEARGQDGMLEQYAQVLRGEPLTKPWPRIRISKLTPGKLPDRLTAPIHPLVSEALAAVLEQTSARLELIPVELERRRRRFYLLNVLEHVACLDEGASELERDAEGWVETITKLALHPIPPEAPPIFRVATIPYVCLVDRRLRSAMESACTGPGVFVPIEELSLG
jgi:hypothetical protein